MVRKHTRRAAKAAFAVSLGVALLIGVLASGAAAARRSAKPAIILGSKNFPEETLLGQIYGQVLRAKGFKVTYKASIGSTEVINPAITSGKINFYPEYTGTIVADLANESLPRSAKATWQKANAYEEKHGLKLLKYTPFEDVDTFTVLRSTATKYHLKTIGDMKKLKSFSYAGYPECKTRITCLLGLKNIYGLKQVKFVSIGNTIPVYTLLKEHKATAGDIFSTDPNLLGKTYTTLKDTKHIFGFQNVAPVVRQSLLKGSAGMLLESACNAVSKDLTLNAMLQMDKAVIVDKASPAYVAKRFLQANGLLK
ncbi:MAG TPA: ABC transporter substrate-binding protein [Gaiellaceae bacterium]|nr:ABC transporter substrate-binding protein [Gaiellaceae bacterium]